MIDEENDLSDLEAELEEFKKIKTEPYVSDIDWSHSFAVHIGAAAHAVWKGDYTPKEYALAMKPDIHQGLIELTRLRDMLDRIWEELDKELQENN